MASSSTWLRLVRNVVADVTPLRVSPAYRRLWAGLTVSNLGQQMTAVAVAIQVYRITGSSLAVGLIGAFGLVPLIVFGLYGGAIADVVDRRLLMLWSSSGLALLSVVLLAQAVAGVESVWLLYLVVAAQSACFAVNNPARAAAIPRLVGLELLPAANALQQVTWNLGFTVGPLLGGVLVASVGLEAAYGADVLAFGAALYGVFRLPSVPPEGGGDRKAGVASVMEGLRFLRARQVLLMTFVVDLIAMVFGMPRALFPAVAEDFYGGGAAVVGALTAAPALGALVGAAFSGGLGRVRRQGLAVLWAVAAWGVAIALFGLSPPRRTPCGAGCRVCSSSSWPGARGSGTSSRARWLRSPTRRYRSSAAACCACSASRWWPRWRLRCGGTTRWPRASGRRADARL